MVKLSINIEAFHPAIDAALPADVCRKTLLAEVNTVLDTAQASAKDSSGSIRSGKEVKGQISLSVSGKLSGVKLPSDSPAASLARVHWALTATREVFCKVLTCELPKSVMEWAGARKFSKKAIAEEAAKLIAELSAQLPASSAK